MNVCVDTKVGGTEEYKICDAIKSGVVTKPVVVWCIGTCAGMFTSEVSRQTTLRKHSCSVDINGDSGVLVQH